MLGVIVEQEKWQFGFCKYESFTYSHQVPEIQQCLSQVQGFIRVYSKLLYPLNDGSRRNTKHFRNRIHG